MQIRNVKSLLKRKKSFSGQNVWSRLAFFFIIKNDSFMNTYQMVDVLVWLWFPKICEFHSVLQKSILCTLSVFQTKWHINGIVDKYRLKTHMFCFFFFQNQISDLSIVSSSGMQQNANPPKPESTELSEQKTSLQVQEQVCFFQT